MSKKTWDSKVATLQALAEKTLAEVLHGISHMILYRAVFKKAHSEEEENLLTKQIICLANAIYSPEKKRELLRLHQMRQQQEVNTSLFTESLYKAEEVAQGLDETVSQVSQRFQELRQELEKEQVNEVFRSVSRLPDDDFDASQDSALACKEALEAISARLKKAKEEEVKSLLDLQALLTLLLDSLDYISRLLQNEKTVA